MKVKFPKQELFDKYGFIKNVIEDEVTGNSRWSIHHEVVFEREGKFYRATYSVGATEYQDESPWEYLEEVECEEVRKERVWVVEWVPVEP